jgi:hypothetical protein
MQILFLDDQSLIKKSTNLRKLSLNACIQMYVQVYTADVHHLKAGEAIGDVGNRQAIMIMIMVMGRTNEHPLGMRRIGAMPSTKPVGGLRLRREPR